MISISNRTRLVDNPRRKLADLMTFYLFLSQADSTKM